MVEAVLECGAFIACWCLVSAALGPVVGAYLGARSDVD